jgi:murein L,D-transpeptidase YcbB/YkuD
VFSSYAGSLVLVTLAWVSCLPVQAWEESDEYHRTASALKHYRVLAGEDNAGVLPATKKPVEAGEHYAGVPRLIRLLARIGDLPADTRPTSSDVFQGMLVTAVKRFQTRHGLEPDGPNR